MPARLAGLFPGASFALLACAVDDGAFAELFAEERALVEDAVPKRQREFATGRMLARRAMARLGLEPVAILRDDHGAPVWRGGCIGSISHTQGLAAAVVARRAAVRGLGLDVECRARPFPLEALPVVAVPQEQDWLAALPPTWRETAAYSLFSAKESTIKCLYSAGLPLLHFTQFTVRPDLARGCFAACGLPGGPSLPAGMRGRLGWDENHVFTGAWWLEDS